MRSFISFIHILKNRDRSCIFKNMLHLAGRSLEVPFPDE